MRVFSVMRYPAPFGLGPARPGDSRDPAAWAATVAEARHALDTLRRLSSSRAHELDRGLDLGL
jgi:predicted RNA polymerase sigma factor